MAFDISAPIITSKQFTLVTIVAESYHKGAGPKQTRLVCLTKHHKVEEITDLLRQIGEQKVGLKACCESDMTYNLEITHRPMSEYEVSFILRLSSVTV